MKIKIKITGGKVHGVGYRPWLTDVAIDAGLHGFYASNRTDGKNYVVIVLAEGDEESLSYFEELVRASKPQFAEVESIETEEYTGPVMLLVSYAAINTSAQLNKAIPLLLGMNNKMDSMLDKQDLTIGKLDQMLGKQDQMLDKQDQMLDKQDETTAEIRDLRDDMVHHSNTERLSRMEKDIRVIKSKIGIRPH
ncbi:MAG: acylphosphatase [Methanothrix sp.]|nr:acylphosphatase [Methanothrix sp.]